MYILKLLFVILLLHLTIYNATAQNTSNKPCGNCEYFPLCNYDEIKLYDGKQYLGFRNKNNMVYYYHCDNGDITVKWESTSSTPPQTTEEYDPFTNTVIYTHYEGQEEKILRTEVILRSNAAVGTTWEDKYTMVAKGQMVVHNGTIYNDVLVINDDTDDGENHYYAKGKGFIKTLHGEPKAVFNDLAKQKDLAAALIAFKKGNIDNKLVGILLSTSSYLEKTFTFNANGSYDYSYNNKVTNKGLWRTKGDSLNLMNFTNSTKDAYLIKRTTSPASKPTVALVNVNGEEVFKVLGAKPSTKMGAAELAAACNSWCGTWKLIEFNGYKYAADESTEYMQLLDDGDGATFNLKKYTDGKLYLTSEGVALTWGVWQEQSEAAVYINSNPAMFSPAKGLQISDKSLPKDLLVRGTKIYEYYGDDVIFFKGNPEPPKPVVQSVPVFNAQKRTAIGNNWIGVWKAVPADGNKADPYAVTTYLLINKNTSAGIINLQLQDDGKLHAKSMGLAHSWSVWFEDPDYVIYIRYEGDYPNSKGKPVQKGSVPKKKLIYNGTTFEYFGESIKFD